jgi:ABC-type amino acid transport/signal transduction systems, periplasmic component/domain
MYGGTAVAGELSVCIDKSSPTAAMDHHLAQAVATHEGNSLRVHEFDGSGDDEGFDLKDFNKLAKNSCALVLGFPIDADDHGVPTGLEATEAYGHTGFVLVTSKNSNSNTLDQLPKKTMVAVTYQTTPNLYFADHPDLQADVHLTNDDSIKALQTHAVNAAMLWQPTVVNYLSSHHQADAFSYHELNQPHAQFNLVALYDHENAAAAAAFDKAVAAMSASGELQRVLAPYAEAGRAHSSVRPHSARVWPSRRDHLTEHSCASAAKSDKHGKDSNAAPALFTLAQAGSGKQKFLDNCAQCHGDTLAGRAGPALKGPHFAPSTAQFHVGDIFTIVSQNMPATEPGSLPKDDYVEIMAFLLQQNGYPAGSRALTFKEAKESKVALIYHGE